MLNAEKYKDEILEILEHARLAFDENTDSLCSCDECDCNDCKFNNHQTNCGLECFKWLMEEYKEPILTDEEREYLKAVCKPYRKLVTFLIVNENDVLYGQDEYNKTLFTLNLYARDVVYLNLDKYHKYTLSELGISYD